MLVTLSRQLQETMLEARHRSLRALNATSPVICLVTNRHSIRKTLQFGFAENMDNLRVELWDSDTLSDDYLGWFVLESDPPARNLVLLRFSISFGSVDVDLDDVFQEGPGKAVSREYPSRLATGAERYSRHFFFVQGNLLSIRTERKLHISR